MASLTSSFNSSKLKLAHINIRSCRNKVVEISPFLKENDIDILTLNETWLKSNFKLDIPNYNITRNDRPRRRGGGVAILVRNDIKFDIIDTCSAINTDNEAITILLKDSQDPISITTIYIPPGSNINTTLLNNIKNSADNIIITGDLNAKHTDFNCSKTDKWGMALKKALNDADLFVADNSKPTHRDSKTDTNDIIDYIISSPAIYNNIQNLILNSDLSSDHSAILFDFTTKFNKITSPPLKVKLYHKADWDSINSSLAKHLTVLQDQILNLISSDNPDPINIINNAATILTDSIVNIHNNLPEKHIKPNTSIPLSIQLLIKQKRKIKRAFIKSRNPFLKSALNAISKKIKKLIKNHRTKDIQKRIKNLQLNNDSKSWRTLKKEMGYPNKGSSYPDLKSDSSIAKTDRDKLKQFAEQLKSVFAMKIDLKDKKLEREIGNFLILNIQDYTPLKTIDDHEEFISINELDKIINNLDIKKAPGLDRINNKLIKHLKPALINLLHFFLNLCINFGVHPSSWKIAKIIMLHKAGKPEDLVGSYRPLSLTSCLGKLLEKAVADNISNWAESNKKFNKQQNGFRKNRSTNDNLFKLFETVKLGFGKGHPTTGIFLDVEKAFDQV